MWVSENIRQTDRQFIQTYTYSTSSQYKLYNEICHVYLHICEIKNEQTSVSLTVTIEKKNILHTHYLEAVLHFMSNF